MPNYINIENIIVLRNENKENGAIQILNEKAMLEVAKILDTEDFIILPSSTEEILCFKNTSCHYLEDILHTINEEIKSGKYGKDIVLSNHIYYYDFNEKMIGLYANIQKNIEEIGRE